ARRSALPTLGIDRTGQRPAAVRALYEQARSSRSRTSPLSSDWETPTTLSRPNVQTTIYETSLALMGRQLNLVEHRASVNAQSSDSRIDLQLYSCHEFVIRH